MPTAWETVELRNFGFRQQQTSKERSEFSLAPRVERVTRSFWAASRARGNTWAILANDPWLHWRRRLWREIGCYLRTAAFCTISRGQEKRLVGSVSIAPRSRRRSASAKSCLWEDRRASLGTDICEAKPIKPYRMFATQIGTEMQCPVVRQSTQWMTESAIDS